MIVLLIHITEIRRQRNDPFTEDIWNEVEYRSHDEIVNRRIPEPLLLQLHYVISNSQFYQRKLSDYTLPNVEEMIAFHDSLPFTNKFEIQEDQQENAPFGSNLCTNISQVTRIHKTSGTSGTPLILLFTSEDIANTYECGARCYFASGLRNYHTIVNCMNYCMWAGGYTDHGSMETVGAAVIPFGVGNTKMLIDFLLRIQPDVFHSTPSYLTKLRDVLHKEYQKKPSDLKLKLGMFGGEGGLQDTNYRNDIEKTWGFKAMDANYGMVDVLSMFGAECKYRCGLHFMGQDVIYPTLINPQTHESIPLKKGAKGELVITNILKEAQPLVRYRTSDMLEITDTSPCECGRGSFRFKVLGRVDDMIVVRGINLFPSTVSRMINCFLSDLTGEYLILVDESDPISKFCLHIEVKKSCIERNNLKHKLLEAFIRILSLKPDIEFVDEGTLTRTEGKTNRIARILQ